jgi:hypothetical protein
VVAVKVAPVQQPVALLGAQIGHQGGQVLKEPACGQGEALSLHFTYIYLYLPIFTYIYL